MIEKLVLVASFSAIFTVFPNLKSDDDRDKNLLHKVADKIEEKYDDLREHAPFVKAKGETVAKSIRFIQPEDKVIEDYSKLRQIALVRHGEPDMVKSGKFSSEEARQYLKCYDSVCIVVPEKPFFNLEDKEDVKVFSSPLNRARSTATYLCGPDKDVTVSPLFREFETSISKTKFKKRLPIKVWTTFSRVKWMLGGGKKDGIESFKDAKKRSNEAAKTLVSSSKENPKVLLTAHGFLNRYIKKDLKKMGWEVVEDTGNDYFGTTILVKVVDDN